MQKLTYETEAGRRPGQGAVTGEDAISSISRGRQCTEPMSVICTKIGVGVSIRRPHACRIGTGYPAIMVATDHETARCHEQIADFTWPERARHAITEIDSPVYAAPLDVREHSFERMHVTVYICDDGYPHWITYAPLSCE